MGFFERLKDGLQKPERILRNALRFWLACPQKLMMIFLTNWK